MTKEKTKEKEPSKTPNGGSGTQEAEANAKSSEWTTVKGKTTKPKKTRRKPSKSMRRSMQGNGGRGGRGGHLSGTAAGRGSPIIRTGEPLRNKITQFWKKMPPTVNPNTEAKPMDTQETDASGMSEEQEAWPDFNLNTSDDESQALRNRTRPTNTQRIDDSDDTSDKSDRTPKTSVRPVEIGMAIEPPETAPTPTPIINVTANLDEPNEDDHEDEDEPLFKWRVDVVTHVLKNTDPMATMKNQVANMFQCLLNQEPSVVLLPYADDSDLAPLTTVDDIYELQGTMLARYADNDGFRNYPRAEVSNCRLIFHLAANIPIEEVIDLARQELETIRTRMYIRPLPCERIRRVGFLLYSNQSMNPSKLEFELRRMLETKLIALKWRRAAARLDMFKSSYEPDKDGNAPFIPAALIIEAGAEVVRKVRMLLRQLYPLKLRTNRKTYPRGYQCAFVYSYNPDEIQSQPETSKTAIKKAWEIQKLCCREYTRTIDDCLKDVSTLEDPVHLAEGVFPSLRESILSLTAPDPTSGRARPIFSACEIDTTMTGSSVILSFRKKFSANANNAIDFLAAHCQLSLGLPESYTNLFFSRLHLFGIDTLEYDGNTGTVFVAALQQQDVDMEDINQIVADFELNLEDVTNGWNDPNNEDFDDRSLLADSVNTFGTRNATTPQAPLPSVNAVKRRKANSISEKTPGTATTADSMTPLTDSVSTMTSAITPNWYSTLTMEEKQALFSDFLCNLETQKRSAGPSEAVGKAP